MVGSTLKGSGRRSSLYGLACSLLAAFQPSSVIDAASVADAVLPPGLSTSSVEAASAALPPVEDLSLDHPLAVVSSAAGAEAAAARALRERRRLLNCVRAPPIELNVCFALDMSGSVCNDNNVNNPGLGACNFCVDTRNPPRYNCLESGFAQADCCEEWVQTVDFTKSIIDRLDDQTNNAAKYSVVEFSSSATERTSEALPSGSVIPVLDGLTYSGGSTNHGDAIAKCQNTLDATTPAGVDSLIILITDGVPTRHPGGTCPGTNFDSNNACAAFGKSEADDAKDAGTFIRPIYISDETNTETDAYLEDISSDGVVSEPQTFNDLEIIVDDLVESVLICDPVLTGTVWADNDVDSVNDGGELGLAGVTVNIRDQSNNIVATVVTDTDGTWGVDLVPGEYTVEVVEPSGFGTSPKANDSDIDPGTGRTDPVTVTSDSVTTLDAGLYQLTTISGQAFDDTNGNGIQDPGEGVPDGTVEVRIFDVDSNQYINGGAPYAVDANGEWSVSGLSPGNYRVDYSGVGGGRYSPQDVGGDDLVDSDVGPSGSSAVFFAPAGGETVIDAGFIAASEVPSSAPSMKPTESPSVVASYAPSSAPSMKPTESPSVVASYAPSSAPSMKPTESPSSVPSESPSSVPSMKPTDAPSIYTVDVSGIVWEDDDQDGILEGGEPGRIPGAVVKIYDAATDTVVATVTSDANGEWDTKLPPGDYYSRITPPPAYALSPASTDPNGSDFLQLEKTTPTEFTLSDKANPVELDAGMFLFVPSTLTGLVWDDANSDGILDEDEEPFDGPTTVTLYEYVDGVPTAVATETTDPVTGAYTFSGLRPGQYEVGFDTGPLTSLSPQSQGSDTVIDSDPDPSTGRTDVINVFSGSTTTDIDAGALIHVKDDFDKTLPGVPVTIPVQANDLDPDNTIDNVVTSVTQPANGEVVINPDGTVTYTPNPDYEGGIETFEYTVCNDVGQCDTAEVEVEVRIPIAKPDFAKTLPDVPVTIPVLNNDKETDGTLPDSVNSIQTPPQNGTLVVNDDGTIEYTPDPGFEGVDTFCYDTCDSGVPPGDPPVCDKALVTVMVGSIVANDDNDKTQVNTPVNIPILDNDLESDGTSPSTIENVTDPNNGEVVIEDDGTVTYTPDTDFTGLDCFDYDICEGNQCDTATVCVTVDTILATDDYDETLVNTPVVIPVLDNDKESDGSLPDIVNNITQPTNGEVVIDPDGTVTYTPNPNFEGTDVFTYEVCDDSGCAEAVVTVRVGGNAARDDEANTLPETPVNIPVLDNDLGDEPDDFGPNYIPTFTQPENGNVTLNDDGTMDYTPDPGFVGRDCYDYQMCTTVPVIDDEPAGDVCDFAEVCVTVSDIVANDDEDETLPSTPVTIPVLDDDRQSDGTYPETVENVTQPANGVVEINDDGTVTYTPDPGFVGRDPFTYTVCDSDSGLCDEALVVVTVVDSPAAKDDEAKTPPDTPVTIPVIDNDDPTDGNDPEITDVTDPDNGDVTINDDGTIDYTPDPGFEGRDCFDYTLCVDGPNPGDPDQCDTATVCVTVGGPVANDDEEKTQPNTPVIIPVLDDDVYSNGTLPDKVVEITTPPTNGEVEILDDGTVLYTPDTDFVGRDPFTYKICEDGDQCDEAQVTVTIAEIIARDDEDVTLPDTTVTIPVLDNDRASDGSLPNYVNSTTDPANGSVEINPDGTVDYTPDPGFTGRDTFTYTTCDDSGCDEAQVVVTVGTPAASDDEAKTQPDTPVNIPVLDNDKDPDGTPPSTVESITQPPNNGEVEIQPDGTINYTPDPGFVGRDCFDYEICDADDQCDTATACVTVAGIIANDDEDETLPSTPVTIPVLDDDRQSDGTYPETVESVTQPANGVVEINPDGTVEYTPNPGFVGRDPFTYTVCDSDSGLCDEALVVVTVVDSPAAKDDEAKTPPDTPVTIPVIDNDDPTDGNDPEITDVTDPDNGDVTINDDGTIDYTPDPGFEGRDCFDYTLCVDGPNPGDPDQCDTATVCVTVGGPVANDDEDRTFPNTPVTIPVVDNDLLTDGTVPDTVPTIITPPTNGEVEVLDDGTIIYTPDTDFLGRDPFTYEICEDGGQCDEAQVTVIVTNIIAEDDEAETVPGRPVYIPVLENDELFDGDLSTPNIVSVTQPDNGVVEIEPDGTIVYTSDPGFTGSDPFTYIICDENGDCDEAVVTVIVATPEANDDDATTVEDAPVVIDVLDNDVIDPDSFPPTVTVVDDPPCGEVEVGPHGTITFTAKEDFIGYCTFEYELCDSIDRCDTALVTVAVTPEIHPWYPDWTPGGDGCLNDGKHPEYMNKSPGYLYATYQECCEHRFNWDVEQCGRSSNEGHSNFCGTSYEEASSTCTHPCPYGFDVECPNGEHCFHDTSCFGNDGSGEFFVDYSTGSCFKDADPCPEEVYTCERVPPPIQTYPSVEECCERGQSWVDFGFCTSRSVGGYTDGWVVDYDGEKCVKDCAPDLGAPCSNPEHSDQSAPIFSTAQECCHTSLSWVNPDACVTVSESGEEPGYSGRFWADYSSGSCFKDAEPCPKEDYTCAPAPPPVETYSSIEECCAQGQSWVNRDFCTSRSVGGYTHGWITDFRAEKCVKDCDPAHGPPCASTKHRDQSARIFSSAKECCDISLPWAHSCMDVSDSSMKSSSKSSSWSHDGHSSSSSWHSDSWTSDSWSSDSWTSDSWSHDDHPDPTSEPTRDTLTNEPTTEPTRDTLDTVEPSAEPSVNPWSHDGHSSSTWKSDSWTSDSWTSDSWTSDSWSSDGHPPSTNHPTRHPTKIPTNHPTKIPTDHPVATTPSWSHDGHSPSSSTSTTSWSHDGHSPSAPSMGRFWANYPSGSCYKDADPCPGEAYTCAKAQPPIATYASIEECCEQGLNWVNIDFCTTRSVGEYTDLWFVNYMDNKCVKDCDPSDGAACEVNTDQGLALFETAHDCCVATLPWISLGDCVSL